jgi:hypothetical protein
MIDRMGRARAAGRADGPSEEQCRPNGSAPTVRPQQCEAPVNDITSGDAVASQAMRRRPRRLLSLSNRRH